MVWTKRIVSVSIGSSIRDKKAEICIDGEQIVIERIGTDGSIKKAIELIKSLDGKIDAFGMGGIDLYLTTGSNKRHIIREAIQIKEAAHDTPIVDGTGVKNTLEKNAVEYIRDKHLVDLKGKRVLMTCASDRFKMTETFVKCGSEVVIGDLIFALGIPFPLRDINVFRHIADVAIPFVSRLPFEILYPTGDRQKETGNTKFEKYYKNADIIAGDYHYIKKYMPDDLSGKIIVTNTVTSEDVEMLASRGVKILVTTTPEWNGRSFGTNVVEALIVSFSDKKPEEMQEEDYYNILDKLQFMPRVEYLN